MNTATESRLMVKLFVGYMLTAEIKMLLNQSNEWKQASLVKNSSRENLVETHFQEKDYIGRYLEYKMLTIKDLKEEASFAKLTLQRYCPDLNVDTLKICIFPQVFVT